MRASASFEFDRTSLASFDAACEVAIRNIMSGTKKATTQACEEILAESLQEVPVESKTLANSAFYEVTRRTDTAASSYKYEAVVGYGGNGDPVNPRTGQHASEYMVKVHEDLSAFHVTGKAKFLEDPVRRYASTRFKRVIFDCAKESLSKHTGG